MKQKIIPMFVALLFAMNFSNTETSAQVFPGSCHTNSINVGTGIDHSSAAFYPYSTTSSTVQDKYWRITMLPANTGGYTAPACAELVDNTLPGAASWMTNTTSSRAINFEALCDVTNIGYSSGFFHNYNHGSGTVLNNADPVRFTRTFYVDGTGPQNVTFNLSGWGDDIIFIRVDAATGTPIYNNASDPNNIYYAPTTSTTISAMSVSVSKTLQPGVHTLDIDLYDISNGFIGINVAGTISTAANVLVSNDCFGIADDDCNIEIPTDPTACSDKCYWRVEGNNILNGNNIFGTLTRDDVRIQTTATDRGIMTSDGLLGWNTMSPTAYFHVDCNGHNDFPSDIRFENLEHRPDGYILIIDDEGYVYNSMVPLQDIIGADGLQKKYQEEKAKNEALRAEFEALKQRVDAYIGGTTSVSKDGTISKGSVLYQNVPNPFSKETVIEYNIVSMSRDAFVIVYDLNGKELTKYAIAKTGMGKIIVSGETLLPGMYMYALVVDGAPVDSKRMVLTK